MGKKLKRTVLALMLVSMLSASAVMLPSVGMTNGYVLSVYAEDQTAESINTAISEASEAITIALQNNITGSITIPQEKTVTLALNGHDITVSNACAIVNKGTLTIKGSGTVSVTSSANNAIANFPGATCTVTGGTYKSYNWYVIKNMGTMTLSGTTTVTTDNDSSPASLIDNGWVSGTDNVAGEDVVARANSAFLTIEGGDFKGSSGKNSCSVVKNDDYGTLIINGGTFDSTENTGKSNAATILNWNVATINDGTFIGQYPLSNGNCSDTADKGELTINGGTFTGTRSIFGQNGGATNDKGSIAITDGTFTAPTLGGDGTPYRIDISGGTYSADPSNFLTESVAATVTSGSSSTTTVYTDLQTAINAAKSGDTVTVQKNDLTATVDPDAGITIKQADDVAAPTLTTTSGETVTVDTDGKTVQTNYAAVINGVQTNYAPGETVTISADEYVDGHWFDYWNVVSGDVSLNNKYAPTTTFTMPAGQVVINPVYENISYIPVIPSYTPSTSSSTVTKKEGWIKAGRNWYMYEDGEKVKGWYKDGKTWYYLDPTNGKMASDGLREIDGKTYYFYNWGGMANSFWYLDDNGDWYFFGGDGAMKTSTWVEWKGEYYYVGRDGKMLTSTTTPDGYRVNASGRWIR